MLRKLFIALAVAMALPAFAGQKIQLKSHTIDTTQAGMQLFSVDNSTSFVIVQFKHTAQESDRKWLENLGAKVYSYIPDDAFLVYANPQHKQRIHSNKDVQAMLPYTSEVKIDTELKAVSVFNQFQPVKLMLKLFSKEFSPAVLAELNRLNLQIDYNSETVFVVETSRERIEEVANITGVEFVEEYHTPELMHVEFDMDSSSSVRMAGDFSDFDGFETGTKIMNFDEAWARGYNGQGQAVAISDTGLDTGDKRTAHKDARTNIYRGYGYGMFSQHWRDPIGHGTHVAGSVAATGANSDGRVKGGAYRAKLIPQGMWSDLMNNLSVPPQLSDMLTPAYNDGARVHTNSWGSPQNLGAYSSMSVQVDEFMYRNPEMLILFAAGNSGSDRDRDGRVDEASTSMPGTAKNVLTVGASENNNDHGGIQRPVGDLANGKWSAEPLGSDNLSDNPNGIAVFSSRGPTSDKRLKPDVVAPGTNIMSLCSSAYKAGRDNREQLWGNYNQHYCYAGGTSMATPLTAGAAAVVRQYLVESLNLNNPLASSVKAVLMHTATDLYPGQFGAVGRARGQEMMTPGPNPHQGYGLVNMDKATDGSFKVIEGEVGPSQTTTHTVSVPSGKTLKVTMVYTDAPGAAAAGKALVNDLNLSVEGEAAQHSNINNHEQIVGKSIARADRTVQISVQGAQITQTLSGKQPYSLVYSLH